MRGMKQVFVTRLTDTDLTDKEGIGSLRQEGNAWYKYCKIMNTTATVAGVAGSLVGYFAATGYAAHRVVLDLSDADSAVFCAGALCGSVVGTLTVPYYGWVQIKGPCTLDTAVGSGAAGSPFYLGNTDKTAAISSAATQSNAGISMNTTTGVVLDCPF